MPDTEEIFTATEEQRCNILCDAEERLTALGIEATWECIAAGAMMGAKFSMCENHYKEMLERIRDHVTSELLKDQFH